MTDEQLSPLNFSPLDDLRRYYPDLADRIDRLPLDDIAQHALEIEREMKQGERICLDIRRDLLSEGNLSIHFFQRDRTVEFILVTPGREGPGLWLPSRLY